jgi:predicted glutamine amidotransferase
MCGITGFIGNSKNYNLSYNLLTKLFEKSESRGTDAAGFWATEHGLNGRVIYGKEPVRSTKFVKRQLWRHLSKIESNLVISHARGASKGVGEPFFNENNHPFTSTDKTICLVHNGRIEHNEYHDLKENYEVGTSCDSEILLRIFEASVYQNQEKLYKDLDAVREIFSLINEGHMAVAIGRRGAQGERKLTLFRNQHRPLWISDLRDELGQIFFFSEPQIWEDAYEECGTKHLSKCQKLIEVYPEEVWEIVLGEELESNRYKIEKESTILVEKEKLFNKIVKNTPYVELITNLDEEDQIVRERELWEELNTEELDRCCHSIIDKIKEIKSDMKNRSINGNIEKEFFDSILTQLKEKEEDILKILSILYN